MPQRCGPNDGRKLGGNFFEEPKQNDLNLKGRKIKGPEERPILDPKQKITSSRTH
jgi:hypothetical protein